jgi:putative phosphoribosyl transferase
MARLKPAPLRAHIPWGDVFLSGSLEFPADEPHALVVFVHGAGSSQAGPRNRAVAAALRAHHFATLTFDLLAAQERESERARQLGYEIELLASRIESAAVWAAERPEMRGLPIGYFGAGTGAAAALVAASEDGPEIRAIVARGGRPDLARQALGFVRAPTLLIVGSSDESALTANQEAFHQLGGKKSLEIVLGADGECTDAAALELVSDSAATWFKAHLGAAAVS